jgi:hypothetical protein
MEVYHIKQGGKLTLTAAQSELRARYIATLKDGTLVKETLTKAEINKTHAQIKAIFGLAITVVLDIFEERGWDSSVILGGDIPTGVPVSKVLLKEYFYITCPICDDEGNRKTLSKASIEQAARFFEDIRNLSVAQWQIVIPDPDPNWREKNR